MVIGKLGAGESFSMKLQLLRRAMLDDGTIPIKLYPLEEFAGLNDVLGGELLRIGGTCGFISLDLQPTPKNVLRAVPDLDCVNRHSVEPPRKPTIARESRGIQPCTIDRRRRFDASSR